MIFIRSCILALLLLLMAGIPARAQNPVFINYTADDGLPSNEVYDAFEDSLGYIWFATDHGISRFDGYSFKNYSTNDGLTHNTVFGFFEDGRHRIWMRTFNGSLCYMEKGAIHSYAQNDSLMKFLGKGFVETFAIDSLGDLWFSSIRTPFGLYRQDHKTGRIHKVQLRPGYNSYIREIDSGKFIVSVDLSARMQDSKKKDSVIYYDHTWQFNTLNAKVGTPRFLPRADRIAKGHYIFSFNYETLELDNYRIVRRSAIEYKSGSIPISNVYADGSSFWLCRNGIQHFTGDTIVSFFRDIPVCKMRKDTRGSYWLTTYDKGVIYIPDIDILETNAREPGELQLLAFSENNLFTVNRGYKLLEWPLSGSGPDTPAVVRYIGPVTLSNISINQETKELFVGAQVWPLDRVRKTPKHGLIKYSYFYHKALNSYIRSSFRKGDSVFFAGNEGWSIADKDGNLLYLARDHGFTKFCFTMCLDSAGTLWIGANSGLYRFRNNNTEPFLPNDSLFRQRITEIKCMPDGVVVVSSRGGGVSFIDGENVYHLTTKDGLSSNLCGKLAVEDTIVWVCSNNGLNRILVKKTGERLRMRISVMRTEHGLPSNLINDALRYKNLLILATSKSLCWFDVRKVHPNRYTPVVYISEIQANQQSIDPDRVLQYNQNNLQFSFIGLLYNNARKVQYRYMLEGYETMWHYTTDLSVRYFNLPAGDYQFVVAAMNEDGKWSSNPATWSFTIPLHFSETWWFATIIILFVITILWLVLRYYLRQRRARERITSDLLMAELKTLRSQMKPHFIFNSLSSIQHFILESDQESAHLYLSRFSALMRKILENTQKNTISLSREIETLDIYLSLETLRFGKNFEYTITIDSGIVKDMTEVPPMLIQPYIENAIWHGLLTKKDNPRLWVRFFAENETTLVCEIEDNGIGRKASSQIRKQNTHQSTGMKNIQERIEILNRVSKSSIEIEIIDLYDTNGTASGTKVVLKLHHLLNIKKQGYDTNHTDR